MILEAIHKINPYAECVVKNGDLDNIEWLNGTAPIAKADIEAKLSEVQAEEDAKISKKETDAENGNQKLIDLGLTQDEVTALTGYKPQD